VAEFPSTRKKATTNANRYFTVRSSGKRYSNLTGISYVFPAREATNLLPGQSSTKPVHPVERVHSILRMHDRYEEHNADSRAHKEHGYQQPGQNVAGPFSSGEHVQRKQQRHSARKR
jgi:hypothetical protein